MTTDHPLVLTEKSSPALRIFLLLSLSMEAVLIALCVGRPHWALICLIAVMALWIAHLVRTWLRARRSMRMRALAQPSPAPEEQAAVPAASVDLTAPFTARATQFVGMRYREGYVVFGAEVAGFVPTDQWHHLAGEILLGLVATRVPLTRLELDVQSAASLTQDLARLVDQRDGFLMDSGWEWIPGGPLSLKGAMLKQGRDTLVVEDTPPEAAMHRWKRATPQEDSKGQTTLRRLLLGMASVALLCAAAGMIAWRLTGNTDYLVAGLSWSGLIGGSTLVGVIFGKRLAKQRKNL